MIQYPPNSQWVQPNTSDKLGSVWATKNVNFDEAGYVKLSPRAVKLLDETTNNDVGAALAFGKFSSGRFQIATSSDANFVTEIDSDTLSMIEDSGTNEPALTSDSHAVFWINRWHASDADEVWSKDANGEATATWTQRVTGLTSGVKHYLEVFASRNTLCITNGNVVLQTTAAAYGDGTDLTIPSDFEIVGLAYNDGKMGVITQTTLGSTGHTLEAKFYIWDGSTTSATGYGVDSDACIGIAPYKTSFVVLTRRGKLKLFNGGGFDDLAQLPFFYENRWWANLVPVGNPMTVDGDRVFINIGTSLRTFGRKGTQQVPNTPTGVWCYDPNVGLYHRYSGSNSQVNLVTVAAAGTNTSTDVMTANTNTLPDASAGTIPVSGNIARYTRTTGTGITGLEVSEDYYIIRLSATTFALATSKENALAGVRIDLTAQDSGTSTFVMYDLVDYGTTYHEIQAAVGQFGDSSLVYTDVIFGNDGGSLTTLAQNRAICITDPFLENRGWIISPKVFSRQVTDKNQRIYVKYRPLKTGDSIVVKVKDRDVAGLPVSSPNQESNDYIAWTGTTEGWTDTGLSEAKDYFDDGGELECEFVQGAGAGQTVKISSIAESSGRYTLVFAEEVIGALAARRSHFSIDAWRVIGTIDTNLTQDGYCVQGVNIDSSEKFVQFKIELRGSETTLEELPWAQKVDKPVV